MAKHRMHRGLVALSATAIAAIYTVGLIHTQPADAAINAPAAVPQVAQASPTTQNPALAGSVTTPRDSAAPTATTITGNPPRSGAAPPGSVGQNATGTASAPPSSAAAASSYTDGSYAGMGTSRFGNVEVSVSVQGGRIVNVGLTRVTTKYPASRIASLPGQVVSRQTAQVDNVTGATASAQAFRTAVQQALAKAVSS
jgi:uncharacterized protein with FMN-binding domain